MGSFLRKGPNASDITPLKPSVSGRFRLASWHRPKPRFYRLDTLCGKGRSFGASAGGKTWERANLTAQECQAVSPLYLAALGRCRFVLRVFDDRLARAASCQVDPGRTQYLCVPSKFASPPYLAIPQTLRDRQVGQNELLVSTPLTPRPALPLLRARVCFSHRIAKDSSHYPDILSLRQHCPSLASVYGIDTSRRTRQPPGARRAWTCGERAVIALCRGFDHPSVDQREPL